MSVNVTSVVHEGAWTGSEGRTGIDKRSVDGRVSVKNNGVEGDVIVDRKNHGGYDAAVYAYAQEDLMWWETEIGLSIAFGRFGENLTTEGIDVTNAVIGERWSVGNAILEVSQPRIPCRVFAGFWERPTLIKEFTKAGRPGSYLRIVQEGEIGRGDEIVIIHRPRHGITIADLYAAKSGERSRIGEISNVAELSESYREWSRKLLKS